MKKCAQISVKLDQKYSIIPSVGHRRRQKFKFYMKGGGRLATPGSCAKSPPVERWSAAGKLLTTPTSCLDLKTDVVEELLLWWKRKLMASGDLHIINSQISISMYRAGLLNLAGVSDEAPSVLAAGEDCWCHSEWTAAWKGMRWMQEGGEEV